MNKVSLFIVLFLSFFSCKKIYYYPDKIIDVEAPKLIAHRGGRTPLIRENTLIGIKSALRSYDGVEVDVQISKDESIWLSHNVEVLYCQSKSTCFPETRDQEIRNISTCNGIDISYTQLDSVFKFISDSFPNKPICIDLKGWNPCSINSVDIEGMMRREGEKILELGQKYKIDKNLLIETEATSVLDYLKSKKTKAKMYLVSYGDFERAMLICLQQSYAGISFKYKFKEDLTKEKMDLLHKKGLKLIAWNVNDNQNDIPELVSMGVDFIQMDIK